ncbi:hypothetical protein SLE2022_339960 [Rubroshorea leprosula]
MNSRFIEGEPCRRSEPAEGGGRRDSVGADLRRRRQKRRLPKGSKLVKERATSLLYDGSDHPRSVDFKSEIALPLFWASRLGVMKTSV